MIDSDDPDNLDDPYDLNDPDDHDDTDDPDDPDDPDDHDDPDDPDDPLDSDAADEPDLFSFSLYFCISSPYGQKKQGRSKFFSKYANNLHTNGQNSKNRAKNGDIVLKGLSPNVAQHFRPNSARWLESREGLITPSGPPNFYQFFFVLFGQSFEKIFEFITGLHWLTMVKNG